jgi:hypothetical protein
MDVQQLTLLDLTITSTAITLHALVLDVLCGRLHYGIESHVRRHSNLGHQPQLLPLQDQASRRLDPLLWLPSPGRGAAGVLTDFIKHWPLTVIGAAENTSFIELLSKPTVAQCALMPKNDEKCLMQHNQSFPRCPVQKFDMEI